MKGFVVTGPAQASFTEIEKPVPKPGQALIKLEYAAICGGDPGHIMRNAYGASPEEPRVYGHEYVGTVIEINNPDHLPTRIKEGDLVVGPQNKPCGVCDQCMEGRFSICSSMFGSIRRPGGTFGEYFERDLDKLFPVSGEVDPLVATLAEPLAVAVYDVRKSGIGLGDTALIIGGGAVGILIGILARHNGASRIIYSEVSENRIELLKSMGFEAYNSMKEDIMKIVRDTTKNGMSFVYEVSGSQPGWDLAFDAVSPHGRLIPVGLPNPNRNIRFGDIARKEIDMICVNMHHLNDFHEAVELINRRTINDELKKIVTAIWPLNRIGEAIEESTNKTGKNIKILLKPGSEEIISLV